MTFRLHLKKGTGLKHYVNWVNYFYNKNQVQCTVCKLYFDLLGILTPKQVGNEQQSSSLLSSTAVRGTAASSQQKGNSNPGISELDQLGQSLLKQSLGNIPSQAQSR